MNDPAAAMRWFLDVMARDLGAFGDADWQRFQRQVFQFFSTALPDPGVPYPKIREIAMAWQSEFRLGLQRLDAAFGWSFERPLTYRVDGLKRFKNGRFAVLYPLEGLGPMLRRGAVELLSELGGALERCRRPECAKWFLPVDPREIYCSRDCGQRARWARHAPQRVRDYHAEYEARQRKRLGPKVKIARRRRRS